MTDTPTTPSTSPTAPEALPCPLCGSAMRVVVPSGATSDFDYVQCSNSSYCVFNTSTLRRRTWNQAALRAHGLQKRLKLATDEAMRATTALGDIVRRGNCRGSDPIWHCGECSWCIANQAFTGELEVSK